MKKIVILIVAAAFCFSGCTKDETETAQADKDKTAPAAVKPEAAKPAKTIKKRMEMPPEEELPKNLKASTPEETFATIKAAMFKKDYKTVFACYSEETRKSLRMATASMNMMPDEHLKQMADGMLTTPEELKKATPSEYLGLLFSMADKIAKDPEMKKQLEESGKKPVNWRTVEVKEVKITGDTAKMTMKPSGDAMLLIKENGQWKFSMKGPEEKKTETKESPIKIIVGPKKTLDKK